MAEDKIDTTRMELAEAVSSHAPGDVEAAFLLGYVMMAEWIDLAGERWMTMISGTGNGEPIPSWQQRGYLNEGLNNWSTGEDDSEEDA